MQGLRHRSHFVRGVIAAWMAFLLSFACLAPLAAGALDDSTSSCCRTGHKCCHSKHDVKQSSGPSFAAKSCGGDCRQMAVGNSAPNGLARPSVSALAPPVEISTALYASQSPLQARLSDDLLRQRPPPAPLVLESIP